MSNVRTRFYLYSIAIIMILVFLLVPRGSTVLNSTISLAPDGQPVLESAVDKRQAFSTEDSKVQKVLKQKGLYGQSVEKVDYGFFAYYRVFYRLDMSAVPNYVPAKITFSADLPGTIVAVKGGNFTGNKVYWTLERGKVGDFYAETKVVRWWLIVLSIVVVMALAYMVIIRLLSKKS